MPAQCQHCGSQLEEGAVVCVQCGQDAAGPWESVRPFPASESKLVSAGAQQESVGPILSAASGSADQELTGIGGWLILVAISLVVNPLQMLRTLLVVDLPFLAHSSHDSFLNAHPPNAILAAFEITSESALLLVLLLLNYLFYRKSKRFPPLMIGLLIANFAYRAINHFSLVSLHPGLNHAKGAQALVLMAISAAVWIPYFLRSRRVELTFVN
jgi:hypothetical protein